MKTVFWSSLYLITSDIPMLTFTHADAFCFIAQIKTDQIRRPYSLSMLSLQLALIANRVFF